MNDDVRMTAVDVVAKQAEVCNAQRQSLKDKTACNTAAIAANAKAITELTVAMAKQTTSFTSSIDVLKVRLTISAAIGGCLPVLIVLAWQFLTK